MATHWLAFVSTGNPNPRGDADPPPLPPHASTTTAWPRYTSARDENLVFALKSAGGVYVKTDYRKDECDYWDTLPGGPDA